MAMQPEITGDALLQHGSFTVSLNSCGNIDHGENPDAPKFGVLDDLAYVTSLAEASRAARAYIDTNDLGGGNWTGGDVRDASQVLVARISYNGRVWAASPETSRPSEPNSRERQRG